MSSSRFIRGTEEEMEGYASMLAKSCKLFPDPGGVAFSLSSFAVKILFNKYTQQHDLVGKILPERRNWFVVQSSSWVVDFGEELGVP